MRRLAFLLLVSGCNLPQLCEDDPSANHFAIDPATGACWEFTSSCDVPGDWAPCGGGCVTSDDCAPGQECAGGACVTVCADDGSCPAGQVCEAGVCVTPGTPCTSDDDCIWTEHCDFGGGGAPEAPVQGACVPNASCSDDTMCPLGQWCTWSTGDCDPTVPGCGISLGVCTREPRDPRICGSTAECGYAQVCPAEYGVCLPDGGLYCTNRCENVCMSSGECAAGFRCNAGEFCVTPNWTNPGPTPPPPSPEPVPPACYGWCVPQ